MFESIWLMLGASNWWRRVTGSLSAVANWVGQSPLHVVLASLLAAVALNLWQWHDRDAIVARDARQVAQWHGTLTAEKAAFTAQVQANDTLRAALASQNASVDGLAAAGQARAAGALVALAAANVRDGQLDDLAARIHSAAMAPAEDPGCRTPDAVMAARDVL